MIQQCLDLALGRAFAPDPIDTTVALHRRFATRPLVGVTLYKDGLEASPISFAGEVAQIGPSEFAPTGGEDADAAFLNSFAERHKARECVINLAIGYTATLSSRARRPESDEEAILLMRDNPERLLGEAPAQGCRHSLAFHPTHNFAVCFAHREHEVNSAIALAARADLGVARIQNGMTSLLVHLIGNFWSEVGPEAEMLFIDRASLFYIAVAEGTLGRPLFDLGLKEPALKQAIAERVGRLKAGSRVILVNSSGLDVEAIIREKKADASIVTPLKDKANPTLWACCTDKPRLGHDLFPSERSVRPFAPARLRAVPIALWGAAAVSAAVCGVNLFRATQAEHLALGMDHQTQMLESAIKQTDAAMHAVELRRKTAISICNWLLISPSTQALLIDISKEIEAATEQGQKENKSVAQIDSLSLTRQEGQPQMRLVLVAAGDTASANRVFQRISALFGRKGYNTVDLKESLVPQGLRYEHLVNLPKSYGL